MLLLLSLFHPKIMYKTHPTMHPDNAATMVFKSDEDDEEDEDDKALVVVFAILSRLAPIGI
jgi:phosphoenolpyruvate carboxylase